MNVLICGKQSGFCRQLADRLSREKNDVYYISGNKTDEKLCRSAFQEYHFPYLNENLDQIMLSASPDTVVVTGAHDTNFAWKNPEKDATEYVTSMMRLFMSAQNVGVKRLVYVSSTAVFEYNTDMEITTATQPETNDTRLLALLRAEKLLQDLSRVDSRENAMEVIVLRLPMVMGDYHSDVQQDVCLRLTLNYLNNGKIPILPNTLHTAIHFNDAADAVVRCIKLEEKTEHKLLQVRGLAFTEEELGNALLETRWRKDAVCEMTESGEGYHQRAEYPPARITAEDERKLGFSLRYDLKTACNKLCKACLRAENTDKQEQRHKLQVLPVIESVLVAVFTYFLSKWLSQTWMGEDLNFFCVYVLVFSIAYGTTHGLLASLLAGIGTLLVLAQESSYVQVLSGYHLYLRFWQLILTGVIAGWVRDKYYRKNKGLSEENGYISAELKDMTLINDNNAYVKNVFEKRLISYQNSLSQIYELTLRLDFVESQKVIFQAVRMVADLMDMPDVAIYTVSRRSQFLRLSAATSELAASCGTSLKFDPESYLYERLSNNKIFVNHQLLSNQPTFGGAVFSDDQLRAIVFVWTNDLRQVNLYASDMLAIACRMIEKSINRAFLYEKNLRDTSNDNNVLNQEAFLQMVGIFEDGYQQGLLKYTAMAIRLNGHTIAEAAKPIRDTDYIGMVGDIPCIILSNSTRSSSEIVQKRYSGLGMEALFVEPKVLMEEDMEALLSMTGAGASRKKETDGAV